MFVFRLFRSVLFLYAKKGIAETMEYEATELFDTLEEGQFLKE